MNYLLDTHTIICFSVDNSKLSDEVIGIIKDTNNLMYVSLASIWEMAIKLKIKKLLLEIPLIDFVNEIITNNFLILPIEIEHIVYLNNLELYHNDPFDRLIIAQSKCEDLRIISKDIKFDNYDIERVW